MSLAISVLIILAAAAFVVAPFLSQESVLEAADWAPAGRANREKLERQKLEAYAAVKEAEFDHQMGKLSDADFAALRDKYSAQAIEAIAALESAASPSRKVAAARRPVRIAFCPGCGRGVPPRANFCPACGRSLEVAVA
jgi:rRNA maturation endonuclease Nob1